MSQDTMEKHKLKQLMRDIEDESIDKSEWIKREEVERYTNTVRQLTVPRLADVLMMDGYIENYQRDAGADLVELRQSRYGNLNTKSCLSIFIQSGDTRVSRAMAEEIYQLVIERVGRRNESLVVKATNDDDDGSTKHAVVANTYRLAFEEVDEALRYAVKKVAKRNEKDLV